MKTTYRNAVHDAIADAMRADETVVLMGEDVGAYGGTYAASKGLLEEFGPKRILDSPPSTRTAWKTGTPTSRASPCWPRRPSPTPTACCVPR